MTQPLQREPVPVTDILWQPGTLVSILAAGALLGVILAVAPDVQVESPWVKFGLWLFAVEWITLFSVAVMYLFRHFLRHVSVRAVTLTGLAVLLLITLLSAAIANWMIGDLFGMSGSQPWLRGALRFYACLLCMALFGLLALRSHWSAQQAAYQAKQAELQVLQARVDPHFLFNTLNTGASLVHGRPDAAEQLLLDLSDLFRAALSGPRMIPLADELGLAMRYLDIEQLRFGDRLRVEWNLPRDLPTVNVPALSIQPLVENAIHHGIEPRVDGGLVSVSVELVPGFAVVEVGNPLPAPGGTVRRRGHHVGQAGVAARVAEALGESAKLETEEGGGRYLARLRIPLTG